MHFLPLAAASLLTLGLAAPLAAETDPFVSGWALDETASTLNFLSVKKGSVMEMSRFATLQGTIDEEGRVAITVPLDGVDTGIDLRNVRMRFMFFETFNFPAATISAQLTDDMVNDLEAIGTKLLTVPVTVDLHGVQKELETEMLVTLVGNDRVAISSVTPFIVSVEDFDLIPGLEKLEEAAGVDITPATAVSYNFAFDRNASTGTTPAPVQNLANVALETDETFTEDACTGRFEILSRTGNIFFENNSAELLPDSEPLLNSVADIAQKCGDMVIQVAGHTDSLGDAAYNLFLSEQRAASVVAYLTNAGLRRDQLVDLGFGETQPIASNDNSSGRQKNRRIEFSILDFRN